MQRASGALHLVHRVERRSMLKLRLVPGGKDGAAIGHGARCSVGSEWGSAVGGVAFGPPCASVSVNTAKARCCCRFTPTNPESAPSASRSPLAVHQARFSLVAVDAHRPWRKVTVTEQRTARDYAKRLRELVDVDYPDAGCIRVVQDNLSTHTPGSLYEAFPAPEARRILERLEFHYTPKHASWLNMVEIEIGVLKRQCLDRRIDDRDELEREIAAWERQRNLAGAHLKWMFTTEKARTKMGRAYPRPAATLDQPAKES